MDVPHTQRVADTLEVEATESVAKVLANSLWGLSRLGHCPTPALLSRLEGLFANYLTRLLEGPADWQPPHYPQARSRPRPGIDAP